ncbi:MAG: helix-turn-helix transcriptional regulator [Ruminococcus sp.]|nr:helix-turn-helix transcriptional regulator [Ruminococcus sp.]
MFFDQFSKLCTAHNTTPTKFVTEILHLSSSKVTAWKNGSIPKYEILNSIADYFNVSVGTLFDGIEKNSPTVTLTADEQDLLDIYNSLSPKSQGRLRERAEVLAELEAPAVNEPEQVEEPTIQIKHSYYRVSAGTGFELDEGDNWETIEIPDTPDARKADFAITIKGNSMEPIYFDGDIVLVKQQPAVELGEIGIFDIEDNGYIKKYGGDRLISLNAEYDDIILSDYDEERIHCFGKVIGRV